MLLEIDDWRSVSDLQYRFNKCFPFLHLQVYDADHEHTRSNSRPLNGNIPLKTARKVHQPGVVTIKSWFTKKDVETLLQDRYGLIVKIFRLYKDQPVSDSKDSGLTLFEMSQIAERAEKEAARRSNTVQKLPGELA